MRTKLWMVIILCLAGTTARANVFSMSGSQTSITFAPRGGHASVAWHPCRQGQPTCRAGIRMSIMIEAHSTDKVYKTPLAERLLSLYDVSLTRFLQDKEHHAT